RAQMPQQEYQDQGQSASRQCHEYAFAWSFSPPARQAPFGLKCTLCGKCAEDCPVNCIYFVE
ncbi:MAG: 4Fe-4S binding protein, partial [Oscillospiraceae bacterium]|nr:4Fe-4S binding protein [Oscillospiraceae bacterium]